MSRSIIQSLINGASISALAVAAVSFAAPAFAADEATAAPAADGLSEIIVTAQRREENQQKTPISISVMQSEQINDRHIQSLLDLQDGSIPSLRVLPFSGRNFSLVLNIRGVGVLGDSNQPARDSGVGVYIDGVYLGRPQGLNGALYDLQSIEVLKGPQGTLFGRNTEGGAVNITTKKPTGQFGLSVTGGVGNYGSYESEFHLDLAEYHGFSVKVDGMTTSRDGTVKNTYPGASNFNGYDRRGGRVQVQWTPRADFTALYAYDNVYDASTVGYTQRTQAGTGFVPAQALQPNRADVVDYGVPLEPSIGHQSGHTLTLKWEESPNLTLKSISSYRQLTQSQWDGGGMNGAAFVITAAPTGVAAQDNVDDRYSLANFKQYQYSEEVQAYGQFDRIKFVGGALAYHEHVQDQAQAFNTGYLTSNGTWVVSLPGPGNLMNNYTVPNTTIPLPITNVVNPLYPYVGVDRASVANTSSYGVYGQATYTPPFVQDRLHLTVGLRWNNDQKQGTLLLTNNYAPLNHDGSYRPISFNASWNRVDPMVNLAVDLSSTVQIYGKWGTGYKSGGANSRSLNYGPFNPESVSMFEGGLKSEFFDRHVRFNIAGYSGTYYNQQVDFTVPYYCYNAAGAVIPCSGTTITTRTTTNTYNTPNNGDVHGIETELTVAPVRGLTLAASYTYAFAQVGAAVNPYPQAQANGTSIINLTPTPQQAVDTPLHSASGQIDYELPLPNYTLRAHLDAAWDSGSFNSSTPNALGVWNPRSQPGVVFNTRLAAGDIGISGSNARLTVSLWVRNLFDEQHLVTRTYSVGSGVSGYFNDPRTLGVQGNIKF